MDEEKVRRELSEVTDCVDRAKEALAANDPKGALEHARFAARSIGKARAYDSLNDEDAPVRSVESQVRQLFSEIANLHL